MKVFVVGATGATGRLLVQELLEHGHRVKIVIRSASRLPESISHHANLSTTRANLLDLSDDEMAQHVNGCDAVASCLGHNLSLKGIYGHPRRLVYDATRRLCKAVEANRPATPVKFVLMNTTGNRNRDLVEPISFAQKVVIQLLRLLLPPHPDNEKAAEFLRTRIGRNHSEIEWVAVRPDSLVNEDRVTDYEVYPSPTRSAIFDAGTTSRVNVAHFMADLITNESTWRKWKHQMPVIYNRES